MKMLQIGAACNEDHEVSWKMIFLDTMSLCVGIALRAERMQMEDKSRNGGLLTDAALLVILAKSGVLQTTLPRTAKKFVTPANNLRTDPNVHQRFQELWHADVQEGLAVLSNNLFRLKTFGNFSKSCRPHVLSALHTMAKSQPKLTFIRTDALDKTIYAVAQRLIAALMDLWRYDALPKQDQQETDTSQGADLPESVLKSFIFVSDETNNGNISWKLLAPLM